MVNKQKNLIVSQSWFQQELKHTFQKDSIYSYKLYTTSFYDQIMNRQFTPGENPVETVPSTTQPNAESDGVSGVESLLGGN